MDFWSEILGDSDTSLLDTSALREDAMEQIGWDEMERYITQGVKFLAENYIKGGIEGYLDETQDSDMETYLGTEHCIIVDAAIIRSFTDDILKEFLGALREFVKDGVHDPTEVLREYREAIHFAMHVGICIGYGMVIDEGLLEE